MSESISGQKGVSKAEKRAQWEAMEFRLGAPNTIHVTNLSHGEDEARDHAYLVMVGEGETTECTCPADQYMDKCKHRFAVEAEPALLRAGSADVETIKEARR